MDSSCHLDHVGRNILAIGVVQSEFEPSVPSAMAPPWDSVSLARWIRGERRLIIHVVINGPNWNEHTGLHDLIATIHREKSVPDLILDSLNLGHPFYFLWPGKRTPSHFNLLCPTGIERLSFNERTVDSWTAHRGTGPLNRGTIIQIFL
jgi:hypothetical protein